MTFNITLKFSFGRKLDVEDMKSTLKPNSATNIKDFLKYSDGFLDESNKKANDMRNSLEGLKNAKQVQ